MAEVRLDTPRLPTKSAALAVARSAPDRTIAGLSNDIFKIAQKGVTSDRVHSWESWTNAGMGWSAIAHFCMMFQAAYHAVADRLGNSDATQRRDAVLNALKDAAKAQAFNPIHRPSDLTERFGAATAARGSAASPYATAMGLTRDIHGGYAEELIGTAAKEGSIKILAKALAEISGGNMGFVGAILDALEPTHAEGIKLDVDSLAGTPIVMSKEAHATFRKSVFEVTALQVMHNAFNHFGTVPSREAVEDAALRYAVDVTGYQKMVGHPELSEGEVRTEIQRLGIVDQFLAEFRVQAAGAGSPVHAAVESSKVAFAAALDHAPELTAFQAEVSKAQEGWQKLEGKYRKAVNELRMLLDDRDRAVASKAGIALPAARPAPMGRAHRVDEPVKPRRHVVMDHEDIARARRAAAAVPPVVSDDAQMMALNLVLAEPSGQKREARIKELLTQINGMRMESTDAYARVEESTKNLIGATSAKANQAAKEFQAIREQAISIVADGSVTIGSGDDAKVLRTPADVLKHWNVSVPAEFLTLGLFDKTKAAKAMVEKAKATAEYRAATVAGYHSAMRASAIHNGIDAIVPQASVRSLGGKELYFTLLETPYAGRALNLAGKSEAEYLEFAGHAAEFREKVRTQFGEEMLNVYKGLIWAEISNEDGSLKTEYAKKECFKGYEGHDHAGVLLMHDTADKALAEAARKLPAELKRIADEEEARVRAEGEAVEAAREREAAALLEAAAAG